MDLLRSLLDYFKEIDFHGVLSLLAEHLNTIQLLHFFFISYFVSRLFASYKIPERFVYWLFEEKRVSLSKLILILISCTAGLSMIMANVITLLALLPVILLIQNEIKGTPAEKKKFSTMIMLAAIWGANLGGMGMLTGTPANGILVGMLGAYRFTFSKGFTFISWMVWAIPLVALLCVMGWIILIAVFKPKHQLSGNSIRKLLQNSTVTLRAQRIVLFIAGFFVISSALLSFLMSMIPNMHRTIYFTTLLWTLGFVYVLFVRRFRLGSGTQKTVLLSYKDILRDFPKKGLLWMMIGLAVTGVLYLLGVPRIVASTTTDWIRAEYSILLLMVVFGLTATFLSEIFSNLVIQIALFATLFPFSRFFPELSWQMMLIITLTSSCAFMTPIATPVNGLGFGASKRMSLLYMLGTGFMMNIVSALLIAGWVHFVVPIVLNWFV